MITPSDQISLRIRERLRFVGVGFVFEDLWSHVVGCADIGACEILSAIEDFGNTEISEFYFIIFEK
jgi:hypothetical protein